MVYFLHITYWKNLLEVPTVLSKVDILQGVPKNIMISALYGFSCSMLEFRGLLDILGGSYIKIKSCQVISKAFHMFLPIVYP